MADTSRHLTGFKVENFKRFDSFEMTDLGQFNLILGDNNVGKTSVLEALLASQNFDSALNSLVGALTFKNIKRNLQYLDLLFFLNGDQETKKEASVSFVFSYSLYDYTFRLSFNKLKEQLTIEGFDFSDGPNPSRVAKFYDNVHFSSSFRSPYIPFYKGHDEDLTNFYSQLQKNRSLKKAFIAALQKIAGSIEDIELSSPYPAQPAHLIVYQKGIDQAIPLAFFGDGTIKTFRFLAETVLSRGECLMIDEIDTGIHFSRLKEFWKVILRTAIDNDVQLFMTTHSEECIRFFKEVLDEELSEYKDRARAIALVENRGTKRVTAHTYSFEQFEHAINVGNEIRW